MSEQARITRPEPSVGARPEPSVGTLAAQLGVQMGALAGQEVALAKAELRANARHAVAGGVPLAAAAVLGGSAWLAALAAAILAVGVAVPLWAAALVVMALLGMLAGGLAAFGGRRLNRMKPGMPLTAESIRQGMREIARRAQRS